MKPVEGKSSLNFSEFCSLFRKGYQQDDLLIKIFYSTFISSDIKDENMEPMYDFMRSVMDDLSAVSKYTENELVELFTKHFPITMHINIWCNDKVLRASIDHTGEPQRRFCRENIVDGVRDYNTPWVKTDNPLELVVKELGL